MHGLLFSFLNESVQKRCKGGQPGQIHIAVATLAVGHGDGDAQFLNGAALGHLEIGKGVHCGAGKVAAQDGVDTGLAQTAGSLDKLFQLA